MLLLLAHFCSLLGLSERASAGDHKPQPETINHKQRARCHCQRCIKKTLNILTALAAHGPTSLTQDTFYTPIPIHSPGPPPPRHQATNPVYY